MTIPPKESASGQSNSGGNEDPAQQETREIVEHVEDSEHEGHSHGVSPSAVRDLPGFKKLSPQDRERALTDVAKLNHAVKDLQRASLHGTGGPDFIKAVGEVGAAVKEINKISEKFGNEVIRSMLGGGGGGVGGGGASAGGGGSGSGAAAPGGTGFFGGLVQAVPDNPDLRQAYANSLFADGNFRDALAQARTAAELDPANAAAYTTAAKASYQMGDYPDAAQAARRALELNNGDFEALSVLKLTGGRDKPNEEARVEAAPLADRASAPAVAQEKKAPSSLSDRFQSEQAARDAAAYRRVGKLGEAIRQADRALQLDPANTAALYERALANILSRRFDEALKDIQEALKLDPRNERLLVAQANILNRLKQYQTALQSADRALAVNPASAEAFFNKAWALGGLGRRSEAINALASAARINPEYARHYRAAMQLPDDGDLTALFDGGGGIERAAPRPASRGSGRSAGWTVLAFLAAAGLLLVGMGLKDWRSARRPGLPRVGELAGREALSEDVGSVIAGTYNVIRKKGEGPVGCVYEAMDRRLERKVAVRKVRGEVCRDRWERDKLLAQARTAASLHHPNIVELYSVVEDGGEVFLVYHMGEGRSLGEVLKEKGPLPLRKAREIVRGVSAALDYAHGRGVLHGDLRPSNVMVDGEGRVLVTDFCVAWAVKDSLSRLTLEKGRPRETPRKESDVYALAACLRDMLGAKPPPGLEGVLARAMNPDPDLRVRSAGEFCALVEAWAAKASSAPAA